MTTPGILEAAGLPESEVAAWQQVAPDSLEFLRLGAALLARLPQRPRRNESEAAAASGIHGALNEARDTFMRTRVDEVYDSLTADRTKALRDEELVYLAAERFPGLTPTREQVAAELRRTLADKEGVELAQGLFLSHVLGSPRSGRHLVESMRRPTPAALDRLDELASTGSIDLGPVRLTRSGPAGVLELRNARHLNAEDDTTMWASECAVDLILLDPTIEVGVLRGGVVEHARYAGRRIFGAGLNLTRLYRGQIPFMFFMSRDLGYVSKIYRGLTAPEGPGVEKLWIAAAETYAIGGACQLLHVVDHVIAARGCRLYLPARKEGIIPGASPLRLPRSVGDRLARQAILSGLEFEAGTPRGDLLCDEVVEEDAVDAALAARVDALTSSGLINAAANRRALRIGQEPLDVFREYMALFAREQAQCHLSPALVANLEQHWKAHERDV